MQQSYQDWLAALSPNEPLSIYLHVPFCAELCLYCGCHTTVVRRYGPVAEYVDLLEREIELVGEQLTGGHRAAHIHWGGGTPTMLSPADFERIMARLDAMAALQAGGEVAIEIDPRTLTREFVTAMANAGRDAREPRRAGLRGARPARGRPHPELRADRAGCGVATRRRHREHQSRPDVRPAVPDRRNASPPRCAKRCALEPDRVALFGYAHVPWMKRHQKLMPEEALPGTLERLAQSRAATRRTRGSRLPADRPRPFRQALPTCWRAGSTKGGCTAISRATPPTRRQR